jgi:hypothetical protein
MFNSLRFQLLAITVIVLVVAVGTVAFFCQPIDIQRVPAFTAGNLRLS